MGTREGSGEENYAGQAPDVHTTLIPPAAGAAARAPSLVPPSPHRPFLPTTQQPDAGAIAIPRGEWHGALIANSVKTQAQTHNDGKTAVPFLFLRGCVHGSSALIVNDADMLCQAFHAGLYLRTCTRYTWLIPTGFVVS